MSTTIIAPLPVSFSPTVSTIYLTLNPSIDVGTTAYYQSGPFGTPKGLLLALTNTPTIIKCIMTSNGLREIKS